MKLEIAARTRRIIHHCPDGFSCSKFLEVMKPGDVLLTSPRGLPLIYRFQHQLANFSEVASRFTHAALYIGGGEIVHSVPAELTDLSLSGGVEKLSLTDLMADDHLYVVLRSPLVGEVHGAAIASSAANHVGIPYDYAGCIRAVGAALNEMSLIKNVRVGRKVPNRTKNEKVAGAAGSALVCSDFVFAVYDEVFQEKNPCNISGGRAYGIATPGEFFENENFLSVAV